MSSSSGSSSAQPPSLASSPLRVFGSSVGTKIVIGVTGLGLVVYLITHIAGNALVVFGPEAFNAYAHALSGNPAIVVIEIGLLLVFGAHVYKTARMHIASRRARPTPYRVKRPAGPPSRKSLASSTMIVSGIWLLAFVVLHVRAFRFGPDYRTPDGVRDLYRVEMEIFASPSTVAFYLLSMLVVGSHLWHGTASAFQSLGVEHPRWTPRLLTLTKVFAVAVAGGFAVIVMWAHLFGARP